MSKYSDMEKLYFGDNLKYLREKSGLDSTQFYDSLNVKRTTWSGYENKKSFPKVEDLIRIAEYFGLSEGSLLHENLKNSHLKSKNKDVENASSYQKKASKESVAEDEKEIYKTASDSEIIWRDKYISLLEKKLLENSNIHKSAPAFEDFANKLLALQAFILEYAAKVSGASLQKLMTELNNKEKEIKKQGKENPAAGEQNNDS